MWPGRLMRLMRLMTQMLSMSILPVRSSGTPRRERRLAPAHLLVQE
jgi:hypothetical protein